MLSRFLLTVAAVSVLSVSLLAQPAKLEHFSLSRDQAKSHALPARDISFDYSDHLKVVTFPEKDVYSATRFKQDDMSGICPQFEVLAYHGAVSAPTLEALLRKRVGSRPSFILGKAATVVVGGKQRPALSCMTGESLARMEYCLVLLPTGSDGGVALLVGGGASGYHDLECQRILDRPDLQPFLSSFTMKE